jgi:hypothetical protein
LTSPYDGLGKPDTCPVCGHRGKVKPYSDTLICALNITFHASCGNCGTRGTLTWTPCFQLDPESMVRMDATAAQRGWLDLSYRWDGWYFVLPTPTGQAIASKEAHA